MLRKGMFLADRYEIIEQIGTGGMSDVYKAKCHKLNRYVAIKVMKSEFSEDKTFVSKFRAEAQSVAGFTHPNVVNVYDVGDENGVYYIVMELVEGITLKKYIEKRGKIPFKEAVSIAIQVANGLDAAHKHNIVHRDIKPQNIIISKEGKVKVTDFGIAKVASSSTINSSSTMGSVHYISPEQARGGYSDARSDIYSLGITIFEMLTGTVPFDGDSTVAVAVQHIQDEIPAPSTVVADIPLSIDRIVIKCTQKKPDRRYQTAAELITDLKKALVMPDEDFVKMAPAYAAAGVAATASSDTEEVNAGENRVQCVDFIPGCFIFIDYNLFESIGFFDESTFLFCEERLLFKQMQKKNRQNYFILDCFYVHEHSKTINNEVSLLKQKRLLLEGYIIFTQKYRRFPQLKVFLLKFAFIIYSIKTRLKFVFGSLFNL